jgi:uncharacterized membrane protein
MRSGSERAIPAKLQLLILSTIVTWIAVVVASIPVLSGVGQSELLIGVLIIIASSVTVEDPSGGTLSFALVLFYATMYLLPPEIGLYIGGLSYGIGNALARRWVPWRSAFNIGQIGISVGIGSVVFHLVSQGLNPGQPMRLIVAALTGAFFFHIVNNFYIGLALSIIRNLPFLRTWMTFGRDLLVGNLMSVFTGLLFALLYRHVHPLSLLAFIPLLPFQRLAIQLYLKRRSVYLRIVEKVMLAGEMSQPEARGHARRVADLAVAIGQQLGLGGRELEALEYAALLHDVGLIAFEGELAKAIADLPDDWISIHSKLGADIARELGNPEICLSILHHHADMSLSGGVRIPLMAKVLAVAEEVDSALNGLHPYSEPSTLHEVVQRLTSSDRSRFDSEVVAAFLTLTTNLSMQLAPEPSSATST